jgi:hypothetical protein
MYLIVQENRIIYNQAEYSEVFTVDKHKQELIKSQTEPSLLDLVMVSMLAWPWSVVSIYAEITQRSFFCLMSDFSQA